jgi:hypothetical protein
MNLGLLGFVLYRLKPPFTTPNGWRCPASVYFDLSESENAQGYAGGWEGQALLVALCSAKHPALRHNGLAGHISALISL